jgi:archaeosortase A (PGF-CTERM-specific)
MLDALLETLAWLGTFSDPLAWVVLVAFFGGTVAELSDRERARPVLVGAWVVFALFWLTLVHHYAFVQRSYIEGVGSVILVPFSLYVAYLLWNGRDSLFALSRGIAAMGLIYMPFETVPWLQGWLVEAVVRQTEFVMTLLGVDPTVVSGATVPGENYHDYRNTFHFVADGDHTITYTVVLACTGIGSMAVVAGVVAAVKAPFGRKLRALAVSVPVIYALNIVRNVFIATTFGQQRMQFAPDLVMTLFGVSDPYMVSYYWADRILSQSLSVVALMGVTWLVVRQLPEVLPVLEDLAYVLTGREYDLGSADRLARVGADAPESDGVEAD